MNRLWCWFITYHAMDKDYTVFIIGLCTFSIAQHNQQHDGLVKSDWPCHLRISDGVFAGCTSHVGCVKHNIYISTGSP